MKGVTYRLRDPVGQKQISIPTPVKGVTGEMLFVLHAGNDFNSHPREGGDRPVKIEQRARIISIPTPVKGVTSRLILL